jgi:protein-S-isoprenylcysteine O-methyltransferase Ste14
MVLLLKNLLFTVLVPGTVTIYVPLLIARNRPPASGALFPIAVAVLAMGGCIYARCVWDFASFGRGTPFPTDAPKRLVIRGLYGYTRNPIYVGELTVILGWALLFRLLVLVAYALLVGICFQLLIVLYEEGHLQREFGSEYDMYRARVGRWLPRLGHCPTA